MRFHSMLLSALAIVTVVTPARSQTITDQNVSSFITGRTAERAELDKVGDQLKELDEKISKFRDCSSLIKESGVGGLKAKAMLKAKCGATGEDGMVKDRAKLLELPEKTGAAAAGMTVSAYAQMKEKVIGYLGGDRNFGDGELKVLAARGTELSNVMGMALAKASGGGAGGGRTGGGIGNRLGNALGGAIAGQMQVFTTQLMWIYVQSIWSMMYVTGATMFESEYKPGQWTQWEIVSGDKPNEKLILERALFARDKEGEWWRTKMINVTAESSDTIVLEALFQKIPDDDFTMKIVRTRAKMPGETEGSELPVPEDMSVLSMTAYKSKPTAESLKGATMGTESIKVGSTSYSARRVKYGQFGGGSMQWWLADNAPGGVVKVEFKGQEENQTWTWQMIGGGTGAKSELGMK